jgi:membrane associated rhomboid family serine protease
MGTIRLLRRLLDRDVIERYWWLARRRKPVGTLKRPCPVCKQPMREISIPERPDCPPLDICKYCQLFWFDPKEYQTLPASDLMMLEEKKQRDLLLSRARAQREESMAPHEVQTGHQWPFVFLRFPVETYSPRLRSYPWVTWYISAIIVSVGVFSLIDHWEMIKTFGMIPDRIWEYGGLTMISSFFIHGDPFHLIGNVYYLVVFGDNVEDFLGRWAYGLLLLLSTIAGNLLHYALDPASTVPCIGASGGISGVIGFYACRFPRAKVFILPLHMPVWTAFVLWLGFQTMIAFLQMKNLSDISALAHLGGTAVGVLFVLAEEGLSHCREIMVK